MHSHGHTTLRRLRGSALVGAIALGLMAAAVAFGTRASANPPYPPPPPAASLHAHAPAHGDSHPSTPARPTWRAHDPASDTSIRLARTGVPTAAAVGIVVLLIGGGALLLYAGKRRSD